MKTSEKVGKTPELPRSHRESLALLAKMRASMLDGGGKDRQARQKAKGKKTARERIQYLVDGGSFVENQPYELSRIDDFGMDSKKISGDGVITGSALVESRQIWLSSQDFTVLGGSLGEQHASKIAGTLNMALKTGKPFVQINDSGGARIQEGVMSLEGYGSIFRGNILASGVIPQISLIMGPCAGGAAYSPALTDFVFMVDKTSHMYITGPEVIKAVTGENVSHEVLGGAEAHNRKSGNAHFNCKSEEECMDTLRNLLSYIPSSNKEEPPRRDSQDDPNRDSSDILQIIPGQSSKPYDIRDIIALLFDKDGGFLEVHQYFATSMVVGFARLAGRSVGIIGNQPMVFAGALDKNSSDKAARFIRFCDAFGIPVISLVDVPGYMPGTEQEHAGIIRHGAKLLYAIAEATVPKVSLVLRKAYGGAYIGMASKALGYDRVLALPIAEIAVMGASGAANIIFRNEIKAAKDHDLIREIKMHEYQEKFMNPFSAASLGIVDDVVAPESVRKELIRSLEMIADKSEKLPQKKHGNMPL
ncbi:acyl-CoA carboxylase subunit beta [Oceanispirochaeta sp.]|uniref:acyl-CoA carboxylase subunit beta n=1 Tax=Oceanispirochaeta sp. TaxID=2035350 RepID=UPI002630CD91|nr:acyl-CoA carboxylase subunit beta [Oceanispirochaeta sp.]MDA3956915.1 acyl-CoA carboxylase subunit beta [Oceanispirochaeta sp.]